MRCSRRTIASHVGLLRRALVGDEVLAHPHVGDLGVEIARVDQLVRLQAPGKPLVVGLAPGPVPTAVRISSLWIAACDSDTHWVRYCS